MKISICILIMVAMSYTLFSAVEHSPEYLAGDDEAATYKTLTIDPMVSTIPSYIRDNVFTKPGIYLKQLVSFFMQDRANEYRIVKRIHDWITDSVAYSLFAEIDFNKFLATRITNCVGYSLLFNEMSSLAGIKSEMVTGYSKTYKFADGRQGDHAWNIVTIRGKKYLVDTTHDARMRAHGGSLGARKQYSDNELFIKPEYKIFINMPYDRNSQLLEKPLTYAQFMGLPRARLSFFKYGLSFSDQTFSKQIIEAAFSWGGSSIKGSLDGIRTNGTIRSLAIDAPDDVQLKIEIGDNERIFEGHASAKKDGSIYRFTFSSPGAGSFMASISGRHTGDEQWETVYTFMVLDEKNVRDGFKPSLTK